MKLTRHIQFPFLALLCVFLLSPSGIQAAKKLDFSGDWTFNESKSKMGEGRFRSSSKLSVKHDKKDLVIERTQAGRNGETRTSTNELTLDGKEVENKSENRTTKITGAWSDDGKSLIIKSEMVMSRQGQTFEMKSTETWQLSEDGKTLTIQSTSSSSRGDRSATLVYDKK